jgi:hypothetical protein
MAGLSAQGSGPRAFAGDEPALTSSYGLGSQGVNVIKDPG